MAVAETNDKVLLSETPLFYWLNFLGGIVIIAAMLFMPVSSMLKNTGSISLWLLILGVFAPVIPGVMFVFSGENFFIAVAVVGVFLFSAFLVMKDFVEEARFHAEWCRVAEYAVNEDSRRYAEYMLSQEKSSNYLMRISRL